MSKVLVTELGRSGDGTPDTDHGPRTLPNGTWDEPRRDKLLTGHRHFIASGRQKSKAASPRT